jgi:hypothetical protein
MLPMLVGPVDTLSTLLALNQQHQPDLLVLWIASLKSHEI